MIETHRMAHRTLAWSVAVAMTCAGVACAHDAKRPWGRFDPDGAITLTEAVISGIADQLPPKEGEAHIPILQFDPPELTFGLLRPNETAIRTVNVTNFTHQPLRLLAVSVSSSEFSIVNAPAVPLTLATGEHVEFRVRFQPPLAFSYSGNLEVVTDAVTGAQKTSLSGRASVSER